MEIAILEWLIDAKTQQVLRTWACGDHLYDSDSLSQIMVRALPLEQHTIYVLDRNSQYHASLETRKVKWNHMYAWLGRTAQVCLLMYFRRYQRIEKWDALFCASSTYL
jgi:hypothetical protein